MRKPSEIEVFANTHEGEWKQACLMARDLKSGAMDWLGLEATLNNYIRATGNHDLDELVNSFTKRGNELPCPKCGQKMHLDGSCYHDILRD